MIAEPAPPLAPPRAVHVGPWIWGPRWDLLAFGGSAGLALSLVAVGRATGLSERPLSDLAWVALVLSVDVAHVWSTLFRTYLDREELARRKALYALTPIACYLAGAALHLASRMLFWRALAYLALFHFVRQQAGWVAIYRARAMDRGRLARAVDDAAVYAATLFPVFLWHTRTPRRFVWFVEGDFVALGGLRGYTPLAGALYATALIAWVARHAHRAFATRTVEAGKILVVSSTALLWWTGIAASNSDFDFTATNVIAHGVPYVVLLWRYAQARGIDAPGAAGSRVAAQGFAAFAAVLLGLAFLEEAAWDRLVWHDHAWLFGGDEDGARVGPLALSLLVPLLAMPQATHYVLDAFLWRRKDGGPAQARALGFTAPSP